MIIGLGVSVDRSVGVVEAVSVGFVIETGIGSDVLSWARAARSSSVLTALNIEAG